VIIAALALLVGLLILAVGVVCLKRWDIYLHSSSGLNSFCCFEELLFIFYLLVSYKATRRFLAYVTLCIGHRRIFFILCYFNMQLIIIGPHHSA